MKVNSVCINVVARVAHKIHDIWVVVLAVCARDCDQHKNRYLRVVEFFNTLKYSYFSM